MDTFVVEALENPGYPGVDGFLEWVGDAFDLTGVGSIALT